MPRHQIQIAVTSERWAQAQSNDPMTVGYNADTTFSSLGLDAQRLSGVRLVAQRTAPERGATYLLLEHDGYPEIADFEEAPIFKLDQEQSIYPMSAPSGESQDSGPAAEPATESPDEAAASSDVTPPDQGTQPSGTTEPAPAPEPTTTESAPTTEPAPDTAETETSGA